MSHMPWQDTTEAALVAFTTATGEHDIVGSRVWLFFELAWIVLVGLTFR